MHSVRGWYIRNRERIYRIAGTGAGVGSLLVPTTAIGASAAGTTTTGGTITQPTLPPGFQNLGALISRIFTIAAGIAGIVFLILFLIGAIQYLTAAGNEDNTKKARTLMLDAFVGLILVLAAWAIGTFVLSILGISTTSEFFSIQNSSTGTVTPGASTAPLTP
ncbi:hypothetical protein HY375_01580 [Candidatus Berkelbacteria bacterium]|nr:hypothetical protein [Candidatus Berkelbacteria bacterium]